jgi:arylsulfatase A
MQGHRTQSRSRRFVRGTAWAFATGVALWSASSVAVLPCGDPTPGLVGGKARLLWKESSTDVDDKLSYEGSMASAVSPAQLGDPVAGTSAFRVCIWDSPRDRTTPRLVYNAELPAGGTCGRKPCWRILRMKGSRGVRFRDRTGGNPGGVEVLEVRAKGSCSISWALAAGGVNLPDPVSSGGALLEQRDAVIVEIRNGDGLVVRSRFDALATTNAAMRFKATTRAPTKRCRAGNAKARRPNVVFVLADDMGYADLGSYGSPDIATPNLDRLASEGARFTQFYVGASVCTPSRATLLTGRYPARMELTPLGVFFPFDTTGLDPAEQTIAEVLRERGYTTALIGKWHLGHLPAYLPTRQGFDLFFGLPYSNDMDEPWYPGQEPPVHGCNSLLPACRPGVPLMEGERIIEMPAIQETLTKRYTERAIEFMRGAVAHGQPFFLYYASHIPHVPLYASDEFLGRSAGGLYGDVVAELDASVGELLRELRELGIDDETLVVFTSDNGPWLLWATDRPVPQGGRDSGSAGPLREGKSSTFEGGMRVPLIARWPRHIPAWRTIAQPATMADWMPTLAGLAGATLPDVEIDGKDLWPLLSGGGSRDPDGELRYLYYRQDNSGLGAYREGRWKLKLAVRGGESVYARYDHDDLLFDLEADPREQNDLAPAMPEKVAELKRHMTELAAEVEPPAPARQAPRPDRGTEGAGKEETN